MIDPITIHNSTTPDQLMFMDPKDYREHWLLSAFADCSFLGNQPSVSPLTSSYDDEAHGPILSVEDATAIASLMSDPENNNMPEENQRASQPLERQEQRQPLPTLPLTSSSQHSRSDSYSGDASTSPTDVDILCGQSRNCACHPGNRKFQVVLDSYVLKYKIASNKQEKMVLTKEIVRRIASTGGRFLKYNTKDKNWQEISTIAARDKVSHALRTKVASWKKKQGKKEDEPATESESPSTASTSTTKSTAPTQSKKPANKTHRRRQQHHLAHTASSDIITASFDANDPTVPSMLMDSFSIEL